MSRTSPLRVLAAGTLWALVYNLTWGVAWFTFMRREWVSAVAAIDRPLPWTPRFWLVWAMLTLPFGIAIMAYILGRARPVSERNPALAASMVFWIPVTIGLAVWGWQDSLPMRVVVMDSGVNFVAAMTAALVAQWTDTLGLLSTRAAARRGAHAGSAHAGGE